jgi:hypothetical protein
LPEEKEFEEFDEFKELQEFEEREPGARIQESGGMRQARPGVSSIHLASK